MDNHKQCRKCGEWKPFGAFYANKKLRDGLHSYCKACVKVGATASRDKSLSEDREEFLQRRGETNRASYHRNKHRYTDRKSAYAKANPERRRAWVAKAQAKFAAENPEEYRAIQGEKAMRRHAAKKRRTPAWSSPESCREAYRLRERLTEETGIEHHVDHEVPLRGRLVSGLHVPENLRVLPGAENLAKSNDFDPMTYEWWPECCPKPTHLATLAS